MHENHGRKLGFRDSAGVRPGSLHIETITARQRERGGEVAC